MEEKKSEDFITMDLVYPKYCTPVGITTEKQEIIAHPEGVKRFIGIDLSKQNCYVCIIDLEGWVVLHQNFSLHSKAKSQLYEVFQAGDIALMEASTGTFTIARAINKLPGVVACVVNPHTLVNNSKKKTDKEDALFLAKTLFRIPVSELQLVSIPSDEEMDNRDVVSHYRKINDQRTQTSNRLHALFFDKGFPEAGKTYNLRTQRGRMLAIENCFGNYREYATAKRLAKELSKELTLFEELQARGEKQLAKIVEQNPQMTTILGSIPGVGIKVISTFIAFVGDIHRFSSSKQLAAYCGLVPRVYQSGQKDAARRITKEGQAALREYLVESVFSMQTTKFAFPLKKKYRELRDRMSGRKAAVAVARKLVELMYAMLKNKTLFTVIDPKEKEQLESYYSRKNLVVSGRYNKIRQSCKSFETFQYNSNLLCPNELGVLKILQNGG